MYVSLLPYCFIVSFSLCMNILIVVAHPQSAHSTSHDIAHLYQTEKESQWHKVFLMDLYESAWKQDYLLLDERRKPLPDPHREQIQEKITRADEIVFCFPLWWFDCPAILKNRFDTNMTGWFAYRYRPGKSTPEKLLTDKSVRIFATTGWPSWLYLTVGQLIVLLFYLGRIDYVGMKMKSWTWLCGVPGYKTAHAKQWIWEKVKKIARR